MRKYRVYQKTSHAGNIKYLFDQHRPTDDRPNTQAGQSNNGNQAILQGVPNYY